MGSSCQGSAVESETQENENTIDAGSVDPKSALEEFVPTDPPQDSLEHPAADDAEGEKPAGEQVESEFKLDIEVDPPEQSKTEARPKLELDVKVERQSSPSSPSMRPTPKAKAYGTFSRVVSPTEAPRKIGIEIQPGGQIGAAGGQLSFVSEVICETQTQGNLTIPTNPAPADGEHWICFANEARVRRGAYQVIGYDMNGYHDDGPPAYDQLMEGCRLIEEGIAAGKHVVVFTPSGCTEQAKLFAMCCLCTHGVLMKGQSAEASIATFVDGKEQKQVERVFKMPEWQSGKAGYYQHSWASKKKPAPARSLSLMDLMEAVEYARDKKWIDTNSSGSEYMDSWKRYDAVWLIREKVMLLADPMTTIIDPNPATVAYLTDAAAKKAGKETATSMVGYLKENGVKVLVRANLKTEPGLKKSYDAKDITQNGIKHVDCGYEDLNGGVPTASALKKIRSECGPVLEAGGAVALHCKAGFGRSGACACFLMINFLNVPPRIAFAWTRICRPGAITTANQATFLLDGASDKKAAKKGFF